MGSLFAIWSNALVFDDIANLVNSFHHVYSASTIRVFSWLNNPQRLLLVNFQEVAPLLISFFLDVISLRNELEGIFANSQIV